MDLIIVSGSLGAKEDKYPSLTEKWSSFIYSNVCSNRRFKQKSSALPALLAPRVQCGRWSHEEITSALAKTLQGISICPELRERESMGN